jgi:hypothetical protein
LHSTRCMGLWGVRENAMLLLHLAAITVLGSFSVLYLVGRKESARGLVRLRASRFMSFAPSPLRSPCFWRALLSCCFYALIFKLSSLCVCVDL